MRKKKRIKAIKLTALCILFLIAALLGIYALKSTVEIKRLKAEYPYRYIDQIKEYSEKYELDPYLVLSVVRCESSFNAQAESEQGAIGLMQIMPSTGEWIAPKLGISDYILEDLYDAEINLEIGCWYLNFISGRLGNETETLAAAFNAGHGIVTEWMNDERYACNGKLIAIPYNDTELYVKKVIKARSAYMNLYPELFS